MKFKLLLTISVLIVAQGSFARHLAEPTLADLQPKLTQSSFVASKAFVGGQDGNGGDTVLDKKTNTRKLLDLAEKDDLDYFLPETKLQLLVPDRYSRVYELFERLGQLPFVFKNNCSEIPALSEYKTIYGSQSFLAVLSLSYLPNILNFTTRGSCVQSDYQLTLSKILSSLNLKPVIPIRWAFTDVPLEEINDEGLIRIENPESKKQLAIQKDGLVVISQSEFMLLDDDSKEALFVHECVLRAVLVLNPRHVKENGTTYVRAYVRNLLKYYNNLHQYPDYIVSDAFNVLGIN